MKVVSCEMMRELDRRTIEGYVPGEVLMERAGEGVARVAREFVPVSRSWAYKILLVAGKGNNGGDAFVAARHLHGWGIDTEVILAADPGELKGDAQLHFSRMCESGVEWRSVQEEASWTELLPDYCGRPLVLVDGLLGTGVTGAARGVVAAAIQTVNVLGEHSPVVAIDVPSGLNADTGEAAGATVVADVTVTMGFAKRGLLVPSAVGFVGCVEVVDIGIPASLTGNLESDIEIITAGDLSAVMRRRERDSHKGSYGHVLLLGGSPGYAGAIVLAARAALRSGAGLVTLLVPDSIATTVAGLVPEAMVNSAKETETGALARDSLNEWKRDMKDFDAILIGPGLTTHRECLTLTEQVLAGSRVPLIVDADALNVCAKKTFLIKRATCPVVLTPHPGEMARLIGGKTVADVQGDRIGFARRVAAEAQAVVVLKGAGTLVVDRTRPVHINMTGNPGMATGGMGDVLGGLMAGLAAQGIDVWDAACAATYLHGLAGDRCVRSTSEISLCAGDVVEALPEVFRLLRDNA